MVCTDSSSRCLFRSSLLAGDLPTPRESRGDNAVGVWRSLNTGGLLRCCWRLCLTRITTTNNNNKLLNHEMEIYNTILLYTFYERPRCWWKGSCLQTWWQCLLEHPTTPAARNHHTPPHHHGNHSPRGRNPQNLWFLLHRPGLHDPKGWRGHHKMMRCHVDFPWSSDAGEISLWWENMYQSYHWDSHMIKNRSHDLHHVNYNTQYIVYTKWTLSQLSLNIQIIPTTSEQPQCFIQGFGLGGAWL